MRIENAQADGGKLETRENYWVGFILMLLVTPFSLALASFCLNVLFTHEEPDWPRSFFLGIGGTGALFGILGAKTLLFSLRKGATVDLEGGALIQRFFTFGVTWSKTTPLSPNGGFQIETRTVGGHDTGGQGSKATPIYDLVYVDGDVRHDLWQNTHYEDAKALQEWFVAQGHETPLLDSAASKQKRSPFVMLVMLATVGLMVGMVYEIGVLKHWWAG